MACRLICSSSLFICTNWGETLVLGLPVVVAVVDLLDDAGKTEQAIGVVEVQVVDRWDPGPLGVVVGELSAGQHARQVAGLAAGQLHRSRVAGFHPVGEGIA